MTDRDRARAAQGSRVTDYDTDDLERAYQRRAARADLSPDTATMLDDLPVLAARRRHRRRVRLAAGAGSLGIVAVVAGMLVVGNRAAAPSDADRVAPGATGVSAPLSHSDAVSTDDGLVSIAPAPDVSETSLGLVPAGWAYLDYQGGATTYGPAGSDSDPSVFEGKLAVLVGERYDGLDEYPLTIAGYPGRVDVAHGTTTVAVALPDAADATHLGIAIQVPQSAGLDRPAILRMANSLDVREIGAIGHG